MAKRNDSLIATLAERFTANRPRHEGVAWDAVAAKLAGNAKALAALDAMETSGGEPDVTGIDAASGKIIFCDCAAESPAGRRSLCFDKTARDARKENKPKGSALEMAKEMGIDLLTEDEYRALQRLGAFDLKTSSWIATPEKIRARGGALFCDRRYDHVFTYHNGADSYYAARGFRGRLLV